MPLPSTSFSCLPFQSSFFCSAPDTFWKMNQNLSSLPNPNRRLRLILWRCEKKECGMLPSAMDYTLV
uniref:Uncharacterized protein n=1 Tax=Rhizophora mucronata TaxID=61149 RepID=A0A2P2JDV2_RHIMU